MSKQVSRLLLSTIVSTLIMAMSVSSSFAHDPKEHEAESASPDCAAMKDMDTSKMAKNDPILQAMLKKCHDAMSKDDHPDGHVNEQANAHHSNGDTDSDAHE